MSARHVGWYGEDCFVLGPDPEYDTSTLQQCVVL